MVAKQQRMYDDLRDCGSRQGGSRSDVRDSIDLSNDLVVKELKKGGGKEELTPWRNSFEFRIQCLRGCMGCGPLLKAIRGKVKAIDRDGFETT